MEIELRRLGMKNATLGILSIDDIFQCFVLEDVYRTVKVYGRTRVPAGRYPIKFRKEGGFHQKYQKLFPQMHKGMLQLMNVPDFEYILIHIGNTEDDTAGCLLVGLEALYVDTATIGQSKNAYLKIYPVIANALEKDEDVCITIYDEVCA